MTATRRVLEGETLEKAHRIVAKYPNVRSAVIPLLFLVQSVEGYVTDRGMREVAELIGLTPAQVLAVSSFYTMLKKEPQGDYLVSVCRNLSCSHRGARKVIDAFRERLGVEPEETTPDGKFTLETAECLATCDGAPSIQINYEDFYNVTPELARDLVDRLERGEQVLSVRNEPVKTSREISLEVAMTGARLPDIQDTERTTGGEVPAADMAPGFRPKLAGDTGTGDGLDALAPERHIAGTTAGEPARDVAGRPRMEDAHPSEPAAHAPAGDQDAATPPGAPDVSSHEDDVEPLEGGTKGAAPEARPQDKASLAPRRDSEDEAQDESGK